MSKRGDTWRKVPEKKEVEIDRSQTKDTVKVCYPVHYKAQGAYWKTESIPRNQIELFGMMHPGMEIVDEKEEDEDD